jgi:tRNA modification GTPase
MKDDLFALDMMKNDEVVLAAEELRYAIKSIGTITGKVSIEEMLDIVFSDFCIGK